jgi:hypothetical protein
VKRKLFLLVALRTRDLAALTAEETIRKRLPGGEKLRRLDRADLWEFDFDDGEGFRAALEKLVRDSNLFVNPNKHVFRFADDFRTGWREECVLLAVRGKEDLEGAVAEETLRSRYKLTGLREVRYATLWMLHLAETAEGESLALAESLAVAGARSGGLLVNPHYQEYEIERAHAAERTAR